MGGLPHQGSPRISSQTRQSSDALQKWFYQHLRPRRGSAWTQVLVHPSWFSKRGWRTTNQAKCQNGTKKGCERLAFAELQSTTTSWWCGIAADRYWELRRKGNYCGPALGCHCRCMCSLRRFYVAPVLNEFTTKIRWFPSKTRRGRPSLSHQRRSIDFGLHCRTYHFYFLLRCIWLFCFRSSENCENCLIPVLESKTVWWDVWAGNCGVCER